MSNPDDPNTWMEFAQMDLLCIENNIHASKVPWGAVAFHAQQAAEKALKAALVSLQLDVPRTHDLNRLLIGCVAADKTFASIADDCALLTPYAVAIRYPGEEPLVSKDESGVAIDAGNRVYRFVEKFLAGN